MRTIKLADVKDQPWKNGGGTTRLLAEGRGWRISLASVTTSGPFSVFKGWWRHSLVVAGDGLRLESTSEMLSLKPHRVVDYDGGVSWSCELEGEPASVINVMCESVVVKATARVTKEFSADSQWPIAVLPVNCSGICQVGVSMMPILIPSGSILLSEAPGSSLTCRINGESTAETSYLFAIQIEPMTVDKRIVYD